MCVRSEFLSLWYNRNFCLTNMVYNVSSGSSLFNFSNILIVLFLSNDNLVGRCDGLASHPEGSRNTPCCFMLQKPGLAPA